MQRIKDALGVEPNVTKGKDIDKVVTIGEPYKSGYSVEIVFKDGHFLKIYEPTSIATGIKKIEVNVEPETQDKPEKSPEKLPLRKRKP